MRRATTLFASLAILPLLVGCGERQRADEMEFARPEVTTGLIMALPVTTASDDARNHFLQGVRAMDMGRFVDAHAHFKRAAQIDTSFAHAYLNAANSAPSLDAFRTNVDLAAKHAASATRPEQVLIEIAQKDLISDVEGQLRLAQELVELQPTSPRAWLALAGIQSSMARHEDARASLAKAAELAPTFAPAFMALGNSYLFNAPKDFTTAEQNFVKVVDLEPSESMPYDFLGDVYRAQGKLMEARDAYTRASELDPTNGSPIQQRGHVNSFLGDYAAARADYDSSMALGRANERPAYALYRAFVSVHAGNPQAAIDELNALVTAIDGMGIPEPAGLKITALTNAAIIAMHSGNYSAGEHALQQRAQLMRGQAEKVGTDQFRRSQEGNIAIFDGVLAARKGDFATAQKKAQEYTQLVEPLANPRKMEAVHELQGLISLRQRKYAEAIKHFEQGDRNNEYTKYHMALAYEGAGNTAQAKKLFGEVADYNFNSVAFALTRKEAMQKR